METLLIHEDLFKDKNAAFFNEVCNMLKEEGVKIYSGPRLNQVKKVFDFKFQILKLLLSVFDIWTATGKDSQARVWSTRVLCGNCEGR